ncbi:hypothetical protein BD779DRAFT_1476020 [Infundibulicybe gibba]|nr:hypothetical protein BD779DRAFT_1476020 [Infundibulicybe gibba]
MTMTKNTKNTTSSTARPQARPAPIIAGRTTRSGLTTGAVESRAVDQRRLYSQVAAASRSPSPSERESNRMSPLTPLAREPQLGSNPTPSDDSADELKRVDDDPRMSTEANEEDWTVVRPRRTRSLDSLRGRGRRLRRKSLQKGSSPSPPNNERKQAFKAAENQPTPAEKNRIQLRFARIRKPSASQSTDSRGEGPSQPKGKGIDPREWGNIQMSDDEMNLENQRRALKEFADKKKRGEKNMKKSKRDRKHSPAKPMEAEPISASMMRRVKDVAHGRTPVGVHSKRKMTRAEMRPADQIASKSYLGKALKDLKKSSRKRRSATPSSPSDESSSSSDSSYEDSSEESSSPSRNSNSSSGSEDEDESTSTSSSSSRRAYRHRRRHRKAHRTKTPKSTLKPIPPKTYGGEADIRAYHQFVTEGSAYVRNGKVGRSQRTFVLSYYMDGTAYDFYTRKVAMTSNKWTLEEFFTELFNYCFPSNYRLTQRDKLNRCYQHEKSVSEYIHELEELYNTIGDVAERDRVIKLWKGLQIVIQQGLWRDGLNPEVSGWKEVAKMAERIEIAENMAKSSNGNHREHKPNRDRDERRSHRSEHKTSRRSRRKSPRREQGSRNDEPRRDHQQNKNETWAQASGSKNTHQRSNFHKSGKRDQGRPWRPAHGTQPVAPPLGEKEREELLAAGKCFRCKESGHMARNCPKANTMSAKGNKPPGLTSFNMDIDFDAIDEAQTLADTTVTLGCISLIENEFKWEEQHVRNRRDVYGYRAGQRGDKPARAAERILESVDQYPGDNPWIETIGREYSQIGGTETTDQEWTIDRIVGHEGSRESARFRVLWKSGDVTWLPYHQIRTTEALQAYFELIGVSNITDVPTGNLTLTKEVSDPQVSLGHIDLAEEPESEYKARGGLLSIPQQYRSFPTPFDTSTMLSPISELAVFGLSPELNTTTTNSADQPINPPQHAYFRADEDGFVLDLRSSAGHQIFLTKDQIRTYCDHDLELKSGKLLKRAPAGYGEFADNFNNDPLYPVSFATWNVDRTEIVAHGVAAIFDPLFAVIENPVTDVNMAETNRMGNTPPESSGNDPATPRANPARSNNRLTRPTPYPRPSLLLGRASSSSNQQVAVTAHEADLGKLLTLQAAEDFLRDRSRLREHIQSRAEERERRAELTAEERDEEDKARRELNNLARRGGRGGFRGGFRGRGGRANHGRYFDAGPSNNAPSRGRM